jgi:hypothetical protein
MRAAMIDLFGGAAPPLMTPPVSTIRLTARFIGRSCA